MIDEQTRQFYDQFWPRNVPRFDATRAYVLDTVRESALESALDAGCGHGLCSIVLAERSQAVTAVDISPACIEVAAKLAAEHRRSNIRFVNQDLQYLDLPEGQFDLVWCWGVAMMAPDPMKVMMNLMRVTKPGGVIYLGLYLKTWLSPVHEAVRHFCRRFMSTPKRRLFVLNFFASLTRGISRLKGQEVNVRDDNISIETQVEDWYYPPYKTFYSIGAILRLFEANGFTAECIQDRLGRMRSATIFVVRAVKR
jgi:2-polyprenyl-6-hydroxyphenyl methylase/3-demethylubiquinone-9 3-methyltransferase